MSRDRLRSLIVSTITMMAVLMGGSAGASAVQMSNAAVAPVAAAQDVQVMPAVGVETTAVSAVAKTSNGVSVMAAASTSSSLSKFWASKSYPYPGYRGGNSPAGYEKGWCFDYGVWAWHHWTGTKFDHVNILKFKDVAKSRGYTVSTKPRQGALAVWKTRTRNHAAYVIHYKSGASTFTVREVRWNTTGPSNRTIKVSDINKAGRAPNFFIYKK